MYLFSSSVLKIYPNWHMIDYFNVRTLQGVFQNDALETSPPMNLYMEHPDLVTGLFSQMTSEKGFHKHIRHFLKRVIETHNFQLHVSFRCFCMLSQSQLF